MQEPSRISETNYLMRSLNTFIFVLSFVLCATDVLAGCSERELVYMFFDNFDSVWPDNANKLAYTFLASTSDDTFGDTTMLVVDERLVMDPLKPPPESTRIWLIDWLKTTPFDLTIDYYRILKDLEEESYQVPREDIVKMEKTFRHAPTNPDPRFLSRHWEKQKRSYLVGECETK